jgi:hypothetical protein
MKALPALAIGVLDATPLKDAVGEINDAKKDYIATLPHG